MNSTRFDVASLALEGVPVVLKAAYLLVVDRDGAAEVEWECLAYALDTAPIAPGRYLVEIATLDGRDLSGAAILVRSVDGAHVLRGDGPLAGLGPRDLG